MPPRRGLTDGQELANTPALVDVGLGSGHVVLFSFNPFWRGETPGSDGLVFNALLHHGSLAAGQGVADDRLLEEAPGPRRDRGRSPWRRPPPSYRRRALSWPAAHRS